MIARPPVDRATLGNGVRLLAQGGAVAPVTAINLFLPSGYAADPAARCGTAHFAVSMLRRGCRRPGTPQGLDQFGIAEAVDATGSDLSFTVAADYTSLSMKCLNRHLDRSLDLFAALLAPTFAEDQVGPARREIVEEIRGDRDDMVAFTDAIARRAVLSGTPYARGRLGTLGEARAIRRDDLAAAWYGRMLRPDRLFVSAASALPPDRLLERLAPLFGALRADRREPPAPAPPLTVAGAGRAVREVGKERDQLSIQFSFLAPPTGDDAYAATILLSTVLGDGLGFRLGRLREETGIAYVIFSHYEPFLGNGHFKIYLATAPERRRLALARIEEALADLVERRIDRRELDLARAKAVGSLLQSFETSRERAHLYGFFENFLGGCDRFHALVDRVGRTGAESVRAAARRIFTGRRIIALVGRKDSCGGRMPGTPKVGSNADRGDGAHDEE